jgi:hypothetical protein
VQSIGTRTTASTARFRPFDDHEERHVIYHNGPLAPTRPPPNQFLLDPRADLSQRAKSRKMAAEADWVVWSLTMIQTKFCSDWANSEAVGIEWLLAHYDPPPPYLISLDDDDLFELTALEKEPLRARVGHDVYARVSRQVSQDGRRSRLGRVVADGPGRLRTNSSSTRARTSRSPSSASSRQPTTRAK